MNCLTIGPCFLIRILFKNLFGKKTRVRDAALIEDLRIENVIKECSGNDNSKNKEEAEIETKEDLEERRRILKAKLALVEKKLENKESDDDDEFAKKRENMQEEQKQKLEKQNSEGHMKCAEIRQEREQIERETQEQFESSGMSYSYTTNQ
ncbi:unnamed protein product [Caenorhabditis sp. 36 PRJEB53466]|nr:unnamed protein product [Caenorhabditis sp. 36 PRJEB53466]